MKNRCLLLIVFLFLANLIGVRGALVPTIYQATGLTPADIQPVVDQFRRDISRGGTDNGSIPGPLPNGWREIDWEQPSGQGFLTFPEKGAFFTSGPFFSLRVSNDQPPLNFSDIDPSYLTTFQGFGSSRMMGSVSQDAEIGFAFGLPKTDSSCLVNATAPP